MITSIWVHHTLRDVPSTCLQEKLHHLKCNTHRLTHGTCTSYGFIGLLKWKGDLSRASDARDDAAVLFRLRTSLVFR